MRVRSFQLAAAVVAALVAACGGGPRGPVRPPAGPDAFIADSSALAETEALRYVHASAVAAVVLGDTDSPLIDVLARAAPEVGVPLAALRDAPPGVDAEAPVGWVLFELRGRTRGTFVRLADTEAFVAAIRASDGVRATRAGDGLIFVAEDTTITVVRGDHAFFVRGGAESARNLAAARLATVTPPESLIGRAGFRRAADALAFGGELAGFFSAGAYGRAWAERVAEWEFQLGQVVGDAQARLDAAEQRGAPDGELRAIRAELGHQRRAYDKAVALAAAEKRLAEDLVGAAGVLAFGAARREGTVAIKIVAEPAPESLAARLVPASDAAPRSPPRANSDDAHVRLRLRGSPALAELVELVAALRGEDGEPDEKLGGGLTVTVGAGGEVGVAALDQPPAAAADLTLDADVLAAPRTRDEREPARTLRDENTDVPFSAAYLALEEQIAETDAELAALDREIARRRGAGDDAPVRALGTASLLVTRDGTAVVAYGGFHFDHPTYAAALEAAEKDAERIEAEADALAEQRDALAKKRAAVVEKLLEVRVRDIEAHDRARSPVPAKQR